MATDKMPDSYVGREQAYIKHTILKSYLQRLFMIVGQAREPVINYVDCFAGPYQEEDEGLCDTSIGVSLKQMSLCKHALVEMFGREVKFRALYIEKDPVAFAKLQTFLSQQPYPEIETECLNGDYTDLLEQIVSWCQGYFTFFFVDPTGWQKVVGAKTMMPLLKLEKSEFLINLMYDFINRFVSLERHHEDMLELFGEVPVFDTESPEERQAVLLNLYRQHHKQHYRGRTAYVPIEKPGNKRVHYYLLYLTRHPRGIDVFKAQAQEMEIVQRVTQQEVRLRQKFKLSGTPDMFGGDIDLVKQGAEFLDNRMIAKEYLMGRLSDKPTLIDYDTWADFLEESDLYPEDFQMAMKELISEERVKNIDADVSRRRMKIVQPNWSNKSERWVLVK